MGVFTSKIKSKGVKECESNSYTKYEKLKNCENDETSSEPEKQTKQSSKSTYGDATQNDKREHENEMSTEIPKCSKSLSMTTQVSPKPTTPIDVDDVCNVSTIASGLLDNPLLRRAGDAHLRRADAPIGPVKLGKDKDAIRLELAKTGFLRSPRFDMNHVDPKQEGIIGELKGVGIIPNTSAQGVGNNHRASTGDSQHRGNQLPRQTIGPVLPSKVVNEMIGSATHVPHERKQLLAGTDGRSPTNTSLARDIKTAKVGPLVPGTNNKTPADTASDTKTVAVSKSDEATAVSYARVTELKIKMLDTELV